jgi:WD40 repeat protein/serine/threonine protein kinase
MTEQASPERAIFESAIDKCSPAARAAFLDKACAGRQRLRAEVDALLAAHDRLTGAPPAGQAPPLVITVAESSAEGPNTVIGPYKLLAQIGEGGMGLVFVAEQQHPVRRRVALKVIKPGMDTRQVVARFEAERQALALMDHPNIAQVYDGGKTASGRPYFVMELVKGVPITVYCDQNQVAVRERLELFMHVCQAVQHAHQKGIIHRDLKPSNVLVLSQDGTPVVKVIDFGVAKAIGQQLTDKTIYTHFSQLIGTPLYMSPEQAGQSGLDVDTRSDIYSLGVLLYELLTGTTPFDQERLKTLGLDEICRILREEEPPKPSTRISTLGRAEATVSANRRSDPKRLCQLVRGELDWIVMKALEKDRNRRYDTASALAADVQRYLAEEPVAAGPPGVGYRLRKFLRRYKGPVLAASLLVLALVGGIVGTSVGLVQARQAVAAERVAKGLAENRLRQYYAADITQAHEDLLKGQVLRMHTRLARQLPLAEGPDPRGYEWYLLRELCRGELATLRDPAGPVWGLAIDRHGRWLASAAGKVVQVRDLATGEVRARLEGHRQPVWSLAFSPDGRHLVSAGREFAADGPVASEIKVWDVSSGRAVATRERHTGAVECLAFSPDGRHLAGAGRSRERDGKSPAGEMVLWDPTGRVVGTVKDGKALMSVAFSPDGRRLASAGEDGVIKVWDVADTRAPLLELGGHSGPVFRVVFDRDGKRLASASWDWTARVWDATKERPPLAVLRGHQGAVHDVAFDPAGRRLATASDDRTVKVWDVEGAEPKAFTLLGHAAAVRRVAFSPDGWRLASAGADQTIKIWDAAVPARPLTLQGGRHLVRAVAFRPDGRTVATSGYDRTVRLWDVSLGLPVLLLRGHTAPVASLAFHPGGRLLASAGDDGTVRVWDTTGREQALVLAGHGQAVTGVAFGPGGRLLASSSRDGTVKVWNPVTGDELCKLCGHTGPVCGVAFSPDGRLASAGEDRTVRVWDAERGTALLTLSEHGGAVRGVAFSPDGRLLASAGEDHMVWIRDAATGANAVRLCGHAKPVLAVAFGWGGERLASASADRTVKVWDTNTGQPLLTLTDHEGRVSGVAFSPDGWQLASASFDYTVKVWDARPPTAADGVRRQALSLVRRLFGKSLTPAEVRTSLGADRTISEPVRQCALDLVAPFACGVVRREADCLIQGLTCQCLPKPDLLEGIRTAPGVPAAVRAEALTQAESYVEYPQMQHDASRGMVRWPGKECAAYALALRQAEVACRLCPHRKEYLVTLGMARYRLGDFRKALETLQQARRLHTGAGEALPPALLGFLAMAQQQLGKCEAGVTLGQLRDAMRIPCWASQAEAQGFLREAEAASGTPE